MKNIVILLLLISGSVIAQSPVNIIIDTDIAPDYDDVGALAILHAFADKGEARILATISCNAFETTAPTLSVLNTYFNRAALPIGITKSNAPNKSCSQHWAEVLMERYAHPLKSNEDAENAVTLYRRLLVSQPAHSVTIVSTGFFTNLANLLESGPDSLSPLTGRQLIIEKVKQLVSMAGRIDADGKGGYEFNVMVDAPSSQKVFDGWPTTVILSGFEIGEQIHTGMRLIRNDSIFHSPVKDAYQIALTKDGNQIGRPSWDQTAVWVAVKGLEPFFAYRRLNLKVESDGRVTLIPGERFIYLELKQDPALVGSAIETLMMHQPK